MKIIELPSFQIAVNKYGDESAEKLAILLPGRLDTKDYVNFPSHGETLAKLGYYVVAVDPPGSWDSPGSVSLHTTSNYVRAINEHIAHFGNRRTLLLGHSRGGATAMLVSNNPAVEKIVLINAAYGPPTSPTPEKIENEALVEQRDLPPGNVRTKEKIIFHLPLNYFEDGKKHDPLTALKNFKGSKLLVHGTNDEFSSLERVKSIYDSLNEPKTFLTIDSTHDYRLFPKVIQQIDEAITSFALSLVRPSTIVITTTKALWDKAKERGWYTMSTINDSLDEVGFIHCTFPRQTAAMVQRKLPDRKDLLFALVDVSRAKPEIRYEYSPNSDDTYPHIYGPLNLDAVYAICKLDELEKYKMTDSVFQNLLD